MNKQLPHTRPKSATHILWMWLALGLFGLSFQAPLQAQDYQSLIYHAYINEEMENWKKTMEQMSKRFEADKDMDLLYELAEAEYGYIAWCFSVKRKKEAAWWLDEAGRHLSQLMDWQGNNPRIHALMGAFYGLWIRLKPARVVKYAKLSAEANERALELGPDEPQAWMEKANIAFYKPAFVGGSKKEAVKLYEKAVSLYERSPERTHKNWLYLNCLVGLGMAYEETGQIQAAREVYETLLRKEPSFQWVRDELYPRLLEKQAAN
jgi:tetratricopeptide (TPR) repeat protein